MDPIILDPTQDPDQDYISLHPVHPHKHVAGPECFRREIDDFGICWLTFDTPNSSANVWNVATLDQLDAHIEELHRDSSVRALVIRSAKERVYIAGADLKAMVSLPEDQLHELLLLGQDVFTHLESLHIPKIAAIHGACVGGGFEMTLACNWRIASDSSFTRIGLPETMLGLIPAWGGCTRLPRLVGLPKALEMIVPGKILPAARARSLGMVDEVVPVEHLEAMARRYVDKTLRVKHHHFHFSQVWPLPPLLRFQTKAKLLNKFPWMRRTPSAPMAAVDVMTRGASKSFDGSLLLEQNTMSRLIHSEATQKFIHTFLMREGANKKLPQHLSQVRAKTINDTAVIGAGVMGAGIAYALACKDVSVLLTDTTTEALARGMSHFNKLLHDGVHHRALTSQQSRAARDRLVGVTEAASLRRMDLIVEAVFEDLKTKKALFADLANRCSEDTILCTNTSALSIAEIAKDVPHPERVIGLHFFNPAHRMPLVEVVTHEGNTPEVIATVMRFAQGLGKTPILVKDSPGFIVNRILMPYLLGAVKLAEDRRDPWVIDDAMTDFGMPMGPLRLLDEIGFDVALHVEETLRERFGDRLPKTHLLQAMVNQGMLGRKSGRGFYTSYKGGEEPEPNPEILGVIHPRELPLPRTTDEISLHLHELMRAEADGCLREGIVESKEAIELAMILGAGYPAWQNLFPYITHHSGEVSHENERTST